MSENWELIFSVQQTEEKSVFLVSNPKNNFLVQKNFILRKLGISLKIRISEIPQKNPLLFNKKRKVNINKNMQFQTQIFVNIDLSAFL